MKIEELYLTGFGRFSNKRIVLQEGLNLFYGENEAGKTTLQQFIVGMLYGFFVPSARRKTYTEEYARYEPWNTAAVYGGTLICSKNGRRYRIQRIFQKERESVLIFDADTGEDISAQFPYDPVTRLREPGQTLTGVSRSVFCNTANVAQLEITPQESFAAAWEDQILSLTETADTTLSLQNVCAALDQKAEAIGSPKRKKTPYGQASERLEQLEQELKDAQAAEHSHSQLRQRILELEQEKNRQEQQIQQAQQTKLQEQLEKASAIRKRIARLEELLAQQEPAEDPDLLQQRIGACQQARQSLTRDEQGFTKWEGRLKELNLRYLAQPIRMQDVTVLDRCLLLAKHSMYSAETEQLREELQQKQQEFINIPPISSNDAWEALVEYEGWQEDLDKRSFGGKWIVLVAGALLSVFGGILGWNLDPFFYFAAVLGLVLMLCSFFINSRRRETEEAEQEQAHILQRFHMDSYEQLKAHCQTLQQREDRRRELMNEIQLLTLRMQKLSEENPKRKEQLDQYAVRLCRDPKAVWTLETERQVKYARDLCLEFAEMAAQRAEEYEKLDQHRKDVEAMEQELSKTLSAFGEEGLTEAVTQHLRELRKERDQAEMELQMQKKLLAECLGNLTFEELEAKLRLAGKTENESSGSCQTGDYKEVLQELAQLQGQLSTLEQLQRSCGEIQEEQRAVQEICQGYQLQLDAIQLAKEKILQVSGGIRKDLTPLIAERLGKALSRITDGEYTKVLLSRDLHIRLEDPKNGQLVPVTALSRGTMDLIYLAMRMELLQVLSSDNVLPLILDDSFVQMDDGRCANLLKELAQNRKGQILLLTCHSREETILRKQNISYNRIPLP